jgi:hypothetical protein
MDLSIAEAIGQVDRRLQPSPILGAKGAVEVLLHASSGKGALTGPDARVLRFGR